MFHNKGYIAWPDAIVKIGENIQAYGDFAGYLSESKIRANKD
jgi:hypothetical protein